MENKKQIRVAVGVVEDASGKFLVALRQDGQHLAGLWEFPGGKVESDELPQLALSRELSEEVGICVEHADFLLRIDHDYSEKQVSLFIYLVRQFTGDASGREGQTVRWVSPEELLELEFPEANQQIIDYLKQRIN